VAETTVDPAGRLFATSKWTSPRRFLDMLVRPQKKAVPAPLLIEPVELW
jgi:hypothetical protein